MSSLSSAPGWRRSITLTILLFLLLANVSFKSVESLSTGRVVIVVLAAWALIEHKNPFPYLASRIWLPFLPFVYVALQFVLVGDSNQFSRFANLAVYAYLGAALYVVLAGDLRTVLWTFLGAAALQSVIILFSFVSLDYRAWADAAIATNSNFDAFYLYRAPGFTSSGGASLSLTQSMGVFVAWLLLRPGRPETVSGRMASVVAGAGLLALASCVVVGRTGLLVSVLFIGLQLIESKSRWRVAALILGVAAAASLVATTYLSSVMGDDFSMDYFTTWAFQSFTGEESSVEDLAHMPVPPVSVETVVGTGLSGLIDGANPSGHDSGFVQTYYSMGLIHAAIFFAAYLYVLFHCLAWLPMRWRLLLTVVFFMLEAKEPFVFKYSVPFTILALHFVHQAIPARRRAAAVPRLA